MTVSAYHSGMLLWDSKGLHRLLLSALAPACAFFLLAEPTTGQDTNPTLPPAAEAAWAAAQHAQQQQDYATAAQEYRKVVNLVPRFAEAYMNLGLVDEFQSRLPDAIAAFEKAVQLKPGLVGAQFFLGVDYSKSGNAKAAIPHLEAAVDARPNLPDAWLWLASAYQEIGRPSRQIETLQAGLRANPDNIDLLYLLGQAYEQRGKDVVDRLHEEDSKSTYLEELLAENYIATGYLSVALLHLQNAIQETPARTGLHIKMAEVFLRAGNLKRAEDEIAAELRIAPQSLRALVRRGEVELVQGAVPQALADWSQAVSLDPARCEVILGVRELGLGDTLREKLPDDLRGKLAELRAPIESQSGPASRLALAFIATQEDASAALAGPAGAAGLQAAKFLSPCTVPQIRTWLGADLLQPAAACAKTILNQPAAAGLRLDIAGALYETGHVQQALATLEGMAPPQSDLSAALCWKARCYIRLALAVHLRLFAVDSDSYRAHQVLGDMHALREEDDKAIAEYKMALARRPTLPNLHYQIGHLVWKLYKTEEARKEFEAELVMNPRHAGALFDLSSTCLYEHQPEKALVYLDRVYKLNPNYPDLHDFLGIAYSQLNRYAAAEKELQLAAPSDKDGSVHYQLGRVYMAQKKSAEAKQAFAVSDQLLVATHRANEDRVRRVGEAEAALKQP